MPHVIVELSQKIDIDEDKLLFDLNHALFATGEFKASGDIKSRIYRSNTSLIGLGADGEHFVMAHFWLLAGRTDDIKNSLMSVIIQVLQAHICPKYANVQYLVNLQELPSFYQKATI